MPPPIAPPDILDLVKFWLREHRELGNLYATITSRGDLGKVLLLFYKEDPYASTNNDRNYIASFNSNGHFWRWDKGCNRKLVDEDLNPTDPIFFERLETVIRKAMVMRVL